MNTDIILLKKKEESVELKDSSAVALNGKNIPQGKYLVRETVELIPINESPQPSQLQNFIAGWLPIATAPKDGTTVITEKGSCAHKEGHWYSCVPGEPPLMGDEFWSYDPKHWMPYPSLPNASDHGPIGAAIEQPPKTSVNRS